MAKIVAFYGFWQCQVTLHEVEAEIAALVECWQGRTIAVMLRHTKAGVTGVRMRCARFRKGKYDHLNSYGHGKEKPGFPTPEGRLN